jgi:hypothetical protein
VQLICSPIDLDTDGAILRRQEGGSHGRVCTEVGWPTRLHRGVQAGRRSRPSHDGLYEHFTRIAQATTRPILIYNIPFRTGVNMSNETLLALAEVPGIAGRPTLYAAFLYGVKIPGDGAPFQRVRRSDSPRDVAIPPRRPCRALFPKITGDNRWAGSSS